MRAPAPLRTAAVLAGIPVGVLVALSAAGELRWRVAVGASLLMLGGAALLAVLWARDLERIIRALRHAAPDEGTLSDPGMPLFSAAEHVAREARLLSRALADREAELAEIAQAERALVHRLPDPLLVLGAGRNVQRANAAAEQAFGPAFGTVLRNPGFRAAVDRALAEGQEQVAELTLSVPVARDVFATVIPMQPPLQDGGRIVAVLSDRTRERAVERMRADFVANASHELRTPLASLIGFIDTLLGPAADDPPAQRRFLAIMAEQARRMNRLIDDLLSLSRIEMTEHQAPSRRVELPVLVRRLTALFEPQITARRMALDLTIDPAVQDIMGDEDQLAQVLQNLLDNAVKYGRDKGMLRVAVAEASSGRPWPARPGVAISVSDDGQGIARDHIPRLTERFYRADKHRSRAVGGTGLGLAIVKHIVNRHRGQLLIESTEGIGTTVTVWLPSVAPENVGAARP